MLESKFIFLNLSAMYGIKIWFGYPDSQAALINLFKKQLFLTPATEIQPQTITDLGSFILFTCIYYISCVTFSRCGGPWSPEGIQNLNSSLTWSSVTDTQHKTLTNRKNLHFFHTFDIIFLVWPFSWWRCHNHWRKHKILIHHLKMFNRLTLTVTNPY